MSKYENKHTNDANFEDNHDSVDPWCEPWNDDFELFDEYIEDKQIHVNELLTELENCPITHKIAEVSEPVINVPYERIHEEKPRAEFIDYVHQLQQN